MKKIIIGLFIACVVVFMTIGGIWAFAPVKTDEITLSFASDVGAPTDVTVPLYETGLNKNASSRNRVVKMPDAPAKAGYTFASWVLDGKEYQAGAYIPSGLTADADGKVVEAKWTVNNYRISFNTSSTITAPTAITVQYGQEIPALIRLEGRQHYDFLGWYIDPQDVTTKVNEGDTFLWTENKTLYALWEVDPNADFTYPFVINFATQAQGIEAPKAMTIEQGDDLDEVLPAPQKNAPGKIFGGWFIGETNFVTVGDCHAYLHADSQQSLTLIAKWDADPSIDSTYPFTISFSSNLAGVVSPTAINVQQGDLLTQSLPTVSKFGYDFKGWYLKDVLFTILSDCYDYAKAENKKDFLLTAKWELTDFTVSFNAVMPGVTNPLDVTVTKDSVLTTTLPTISSTGQNFLGWFIGAAEFKTLNDCLLYSLNQKIDTFTLIARWEITPFTITFDADLTGVANPADITVTKDSDFAQTLPFVSSFGYAFLGWFIDAEEFKILEDCMTYSLSEEKSTVTLTAKWEVDPYPFTISFDANITGVTNPESKTITKGTELTENLPLLSKAGHTFLGWFIEADEFETIGDCLTYSITEGQRDIKLTAKWAVITYPFTINFEANLAGVTNPTEKIINDGDSLTDALPTLASTGHIFDGWFIGTREFKTVGDCFNYTSAQGVQTITLHAKWTVDPYPFTISFNANLADVTNPADKIVSNSNNLMEALPTLSSTGYIFGGWFIGSIKFVTVNDCYFYSSSTEQKAITLTAKWTVDPYPFTVSFTSGLAGVANPTAKTINRGDNLTETLPTISGADHTFDGWFIGSKKFINLSDCFNHASTAGENSITLTGKWTAITHTFTFQINHPVAYFTGLGSGVSSYPITVTNNDFNVGFPAVTSPNWIFDGWRFGSELITSGTLATIKAKMPAGIYTATLTAEFTESRRTIYFNVNGGTTEAPYTNITSADNTKKLPTNTWREFYYLEGWYYNGTKVQTVGDVLNISGTNTNITLEAKWTEGYVYRVWALLDDGTKMEWYHGFSAWTVANSTVITDTTVFGTAVNGYTFSHWEIDEVNVGKGIGANHQISFKVTKHHFDIDAIFIKNK